jgi:Cys-tRNA(Pro)/Cys-tRNA(Cys) deacylase
MQLPAHDYLDKLGLPYTRATFPVNTEKGAANVAQALGYGERQMVKTLIFTVEPRPQPEDTQPDDKSEHILVMVGGDQNIVSGLLKKAVGSRNIQMASFETIHTLTSYVVGSIPPFGWQPAGLRAFLDETLLNEEILGVGAGVWGQEILITPQHLLQAAQAQVVNLTDKTRR